MNLTGLQFDEESWRYSRLADKLPAELNPQALIPSQNADITLMGNQYHVRELPTGVAVIEVATQMTSLFTRDDMANLPAKLTKTLRLLVTSTPSRPLRIAVVRTSGPLEGAMASLELTVKAGAKCAVLQECSGGEEGTTVQALKFHVEAQAQLDHAVIIREGSAAIHVATLDYQLEQQAVLHQTVLSFGARLARVQLGVTLNGEDAYAHLASLNALSGKSHMDYHSHIQHNVARSFSTQKAKNFLDGESRGIFTGRIVIAKDAQQVIAQQMNRNLLLSKKAHALGQPQLEIYADDVKCAHGSSTGMVEEESIFYLISRGITPKRAQEMLSQAFVQEVFNNAQHPTLTQALQTAFEGRA